MYNTHMENERGQKAGIGEILGGRIEVVSSDPSAPLYLVQRADVAALASIWMGEPIHNRNKIGKYTKWLQKNPVNK